MGGGSPSTNGMGKMQMAVALGIALLAGSCSSPDPLATIDGNDLERQELEQLHVDISHLDEDEVAASTLLLVLHHAFSTQARTEFEIDLDPTMVGRAFADRTVRYAHQPDLDLALAAENLTRRRILIESELDTLRDAIAEELVLSESGNFDLDTAYRAYLLDNGEVCIRQITLLSVDSYDMVLARLEAGGDFDALAREYSNDPFVHREEGKVGAGGDLGCSAPAALPHGLDEASLGAPVGEAYGPVFSDVGLHLLWVYERTAPVLEDVHDDVHLHAVPLQGPDLFRDWAIDVLQTIEVDVDEAYGTWGVLPETDGVPTVVPTYRIHLIIP